jgi:iron complex transport system ATP-binding protein
MALLEVRHLTLPTRLKDIGFSLEHGTMLGVIGANGAGKSSLLQSLAALLPAAGDIWLDGIPLATLPPIERARKIGFLPQFCDSAWPLTVEEVVALGRLPWHDRATPTGKAAIQRAMHDTGIVEMARAPIKRLSGGEQARVWLARVLAGMPRLIVADEPIASLDLFYQSKIMAMLQKYARAGLGVILAIHDIPLAARYCDCFCLLHRGTCMAFGKPSTVLTEPCLSKAFGIPIHVDLAHTPPIILPA